MSANLSLSLGSRRSRALTDELGVARPKVSAWLDNSTIGVDAVASVAERIAGTNPATQTTAGRRPTGNADRSMTFAANDSLAWPLNAANNQTTKTGVCFYVKQPVSALETLFAIYDAAGGASARKYFLQTGSARRLIAGVYISGTAGRQLTSPVDVLPVAGVAGFVRFSYDSSLGGDANVRMFVNRVSVGALTGVALGAGGTLGVLPAPTGFATIGDLTNGVAVVPYNGTIGRHIFMLNDDLTFAEETVLMGLNPLV